MGKSPIEFCDTKGQEEENSNSIGSYPVESNHLCTLLTYSSLISRHSVSNNVHSTASDLR